MTTVYVLIALFTNTPMNLGVYHTYDYCETAREIIQGQFRGAPDAVVMCLKVLREKEPPE